MTASNSAFVSYRRDPGYASAKLIWSGLRAAGIDAFLDLESMNEAGNFDAKILNQISGRPYFVLVLTDGTLDRCANPGDWLWRELDFAVTQGRIIVPAMIPPFDMADADLLPSPAVADTLRRSNGVTFPPAFFDAAVEQLVGRLRPTELSLRTFSPDDRDFARRAAQNVEHRSDEDDQGSWNRRRVALVIAACVVVLGLVGVFLLAGRDDSPGSADSTSPTSPPSSASSTSIESASDHQLDADEVLEPGQQLTSINGRHVLEMTMDGRLVASTDGREWWRSDNVSYISAVARMQHDGNLVVYKTAASTAQGEAVWASETQRYPGSSLSVEEDVDGRGVIAIYTPDGTAVFRRVDAAHARHDGIDPAGHDRPGRVDCARRGWTQQQRRPVPTGKRAGTSCTSRFRVSPTTTFRSVSSSAQIHPTARPSTSVVRSNLWCPMAHWLFQTSRA